MNSFFVIYFYYFFYHFFIMERILKGKRKQICRITRGEFLIESMLRFADNVVDLFTSISSTKAGRSYWYPPKSLEKFDLECFTLLTPQLSHEYIFIKFELVRVPRAFFKSGFIYHFTYFSTYEYLMRYHIAILY